MRLKVKLHDAVTIKNLVLAASSLPCDVDLHRMAVMMQQAPDF